MSDALSGKPADGSRRSQTSTDVTTSAGLPSEVSENTRLRILVVDEGQNGNSLAGLISLFDLVALLNTNKA